MQGKEFIVITLCVRYTETRKKGGWHLLNINLFVNAVPSGEKIPVAVLPATPDDLAATKTWQTRWTTKAAIEMPNKVALKRVDDGELLGLMSYEVEDAILAVEIIYIESAAHSNTNLLRKKGEDKRYLNIARALIAYAVKISIEAGYGGVLLFKAKTDELLEYYKREFGAVQVARYDPYRLVIWEDEAEAIISEYREG